MFTWMIEDSRIEYLSTDVACPANLPGTRQRVELSCVGRRWIFERCGDLETLWDMMEDDPTGDERLPYWVEIWPASLVMADHLAKNRDLIEGENCLDVGCGLGLTAIVGSWLGAKVVGMDYEWPALVFAKENAILNKVPQPGWVVMDWRDPGFVPGSFSFIWGGDIVYEKRFFDPLSAMFQEVLAPGGRIWIAEPFREVSKSVWDAWKGLGWKVDKLGTTLAPMNNHGVTVNLWKCPGDRLDYGLMSLVRLTPLLFFANLKLEANLSLELNRFFQ